jgi:hypothetical protein
MEAVTRGERKQLDQASGSPEPPLVLLDGPRPHRDRETAEHPYPNSLWFVVYHRCLLLAAMITMVMDRDYTPAKEGHRVEYSVFFTLVEIFTSVELLLPGWVESTGSACFH